MTEINETINEPLAGEGQEATAATSPKAKKPFWEKVERFYLQFEGTKRLIAFCVTAVLLIGIAIGLTSFCRGLFGTKHNKLEIKNTITEVLSTSDFKIARMPFNGTAKWIDTEEGKTIATVYYKGYVQFSFDWAKMTVTERDKEIVISVPAIVQDPYVEPGQKTILFDSLSMKQKYEDAKKYNAEVEDVCKKDMKTGIENHPEIIKTVQSYVENYLKSLFGDFFSKDIVVEIGGAR